MSSVLLKKSKSFVRSEEGSVETGLVLIPVMILFLSVLQLPASTLARVVSSSKLQSDTYLQSFVPTEGASSISNQTLTGNRDSLSEGSTESLALPGGGELMIKNRRIVAPPITPFLISGDQFNSIGISINENK